MPLALATHSPLLDGKLLSDSYNYPFWGLPDGLSESLLFQEEVSRSY